jgi:hypothetical protein
VTPPGRHLRPVPDPDCAADLDHAETGGPIGRGLAGLLAPSAPPVPGDSFLDLVAAAGTVSPLHGDIADLSAGELLTMLGGPPDPAGPPTPLTPALGERDRAALLQRLSVTAWEVVRTGAAEHDPVLLDALVHVCTRLSAQSGS